MSATANNVGEQWSGANPKTPLPPLNSHDDDGRNALQGLLAFACIHQQAVRRRREAVSATTSASPRFSREEELALDEILQLVAARAIALTGADGVAIALAKDKAIVCRASAGKIAPDPGAKLDPHSGFSGACLLGGETVRCDDSENDPRVNAEACRALGARSMIAVPLCAKQRVIGLVEAFSSEAHGFNESDVRSLNLLGELILSAIRPEEEHHLAAMAKEVLPQTALRTQEAPAENADPVPASKVLVDEKFAPAVLPLTAATPAVAAVEIKPTETSAPADQEQAPIPAEPEPLKITLSTKRPSKVEAPGEAPREKHPLVSIAVTAAAVLVAVALLGALVWKGQRVTQAISANTQAASELKAPDAQPKDDVSASPVEPVSAQSPSPPLTIGSTAQVTDIHHSSSSDRSTVVVDLEDQVQYEEHSLDNPPRIYFDLHDTKLTAALQNRTINIDDAFLKRLRVAQPVDGITRVVLETKNQPDLSVSLDTNPYRLTIEVHKAGMASSSQPGTRPVLPKPSPAISVAPKKPEASSGLPTATEALHIVLDAGHGGWDLGTVGRKGLLEKDLVLDIVQRLGSLLETRLGASVTYTRSDDSYLPLEKRAEIANLAKADFFLSVHANYSDLSTARGVETYYTNTYSSVKARAADDPPMLQQVNWSDVVDIRAKVIDSRRLAADIQQALYTGLAARNPEIRNRGVKEAQYVVLTGTQVPAVLAEVSFVSSPADEDKLRNSEYRQLIAEALYKGVVKYRNEIRRTRVAKLQAAAH